MKFRLIEKREFFDDIAKKSKKDPTKGKRGWFTSFLPDKEKGMEVLNKNLGNDTSGTSEVTSSSSGEASGGCCEELIDEDRVLNADGSLTRKAQILLDVYENSGQFSKADLLRRSGYPNWDRAGHWSTQWSDFNHKGLIICKKGKVFEGPNLEDWITKENATSFSEKAKAAKKEFEDKIDKEFELAGIQCVDDNIVSFPDDYFN